MNLINFNKANLLIKTFLENNNLYDFLKSDQNIYIGGSLPFMCLSSKISNSSKLNVGDIDIYTTNCPLLFRNINKSFGIKNLVKTGVNVKFDIDNVEIPIQIITSPFDDFESDVLDEYDCGMVSVGFHPYSNKFIIHPKFISQLENRKFIVIHERTNPSRIIKLKERAKELFDSTLEEIKLDSNTDYRPYWKNKISIDSLGDLMPSPPYTQLYANKYRCIGCKEKQDYLICKICQHRMSNHFVNEIKTNNFISKYKRVVVFGGLNGLGKIIADEIVEIGQDKIKVSRTSRNGGKDIDTFKFNLEDYLRLLIRKQDFDILELPELLDKNLLSNIIQADLIIFNAYQTLEGDQQIWNTNLKTFNPKLSMDRFRINCWGYIGLLHHILEARKKFITDSHLNNEFNIHDQIFVWIDANESRFEGKLLDGKHLELNMAKTACKQIFYTNANIMSGLGILFLCWDCGWCSFHGISVDKIASKSKYLVPPKLSTLGLIYYLSLIDIEKLYEEKKYIHDMTFYKCIDLTKINFNLKITSDELENIIKTELDNKLKIIEKSKNTIFK